MGYLYDYGYLKNKKVLLIVFLLIISFMIVEVVGGFVINSLVLLFDVGYMLSDVVFLVLSLFVFKFGEKIVIIVKIYGYK